MTLWFVFALMTAAAIFAVLLPLGLRGGAQAEGNEATVYKDQLGEIDRDLGAGLIGAAEADAARVGISRRLLAVADHDRNPPMQSNLKLRRSAAVLALVGLPVLALAIYLPLGSPRLADFPLAERARPTDTAQPLETLVAQVEQHLEKNPTDGRGWIVLAPVLARLGRYDEAVKAFHSAISYGGDSADRRADLGEANQAKANYYLGLAAQQDGRSADAASIWRAMLAKAPADAPWRPLVQAALTRVDGPTAPALSDSAVAAAKNMTGNDREAMIRGMVDRLATRLKQNGDDVDGWLRLVRAYMVLGDRDKAKSAGADARQAVANNAERLRQLNEGLKNLGLDG
jgi:cytochrome c-type biogenesis protein CcmH